MIYFIEAPFDSALFDKKLAEIKGIKMCQFCHKNEVEAGTKTCGLCRRRIRRGSRNIWVGVPRRPVNASEITPIEDGIEAGIFANDHGSYFIESLAADDDNPSFENARRAREDGR